MKYIKLVSSISEMISSINIKRLTNLIYLYVVLIMNLFYLKNSFKWSKVKNLKINLFEIVYRNTNIVKYRTFSIEVSIKIAITIYLLSSYTLCYQSFAFIELFVTSKMSVVSASIDRLNKTTRTKKKYTKSFSMSNNLYITK